MLNENTIIEKIKWPHKNSDNLK